ARRREGGRALRARAPARAHERRRHAARVAHRQRHHHRRRHPAPVNRSGPGELTLVAVALVGITTYSALAGTESGEVTLAAVGLFAMVLFIAGVAWPCIALARLEVGATTQTDATVGDVVPVQLDVKGRVSRLEVRALDPPSEWRTCRAPGSGELLHIASRRGVFRYLRVEVRSAAPLGVFQRRRVLVAPLARP